jgi:vesicle-fusing ATPase
MSAVVDKTPFKFTVVSTPLQHLVYTNHVYFNESAEILLNERAGQSDTETYVQVNKKIVFVARGIKEVHVDDIALSSVQRETLKVNHGSHVSVLPWYAPTNGSADLITLSLEFELLGTKNRRVHIVASELAQQLVKCLVGQVLTKGQIIGFDHQFTPLRITVLACEAGLPVNEQDMSVKRTRNGINTFKDEQDEFDEKGDDDNDNDGQITREVMHGIVYSGTNIELSALPNKYLTFKVATKKLAMLNPKFRFSDMGVGGLNAEFGMIFRRAFASRLFPVDITKKLGIKHVKGMLLYGPPGTGQSHKSGC